MSQIPSSYLDSVAAIGAQINGETHWLGTGFVYGSVIEGRENRYNPFLVTNKHVIKDLHNIILRFNPANGEAAKDYPMNLVSNDGKQLWMGHPNPDVDIAVMPILLNIVQNDGMKWGFFQSDFHSFTVNEMEENRLYEGESIFVLGFPMGLVTSDRQYVFARGGIISRIKDIYEKRSKDYVIDALVFPGNSGGPVISKADPVGIEGTKTCEKSSLIGVVKSYIPISRYCL